MKTKAELPAESMLLPVVFPGYMVIDAECNICGHTMIAVAPVGTEGLTCPKCGHANDDFAWVPDWREPIAHDGAWLTGELDFIGFSQDNDAPDAWWDEAEENDESDDLERVTLPGWMVRVIAFLILVRQLFAKGNAHGC